MQKGSFHCYYGVNGILLSVLTSGASPITTFKEAIIQVEFLSKNFLPVYLLMVI